MLILQGGRDYQVTVADDLVRWQAGLAGRPDVTIRIYDADDHMFFAGAGDSTPADYQLPQHVDPAVVADIADWLALGRRADRPAHLLPQAVNLAGAGIEDVSGVIKMLHAKEFELLSNG